MIPKVIHYCWFGGNPLPDNLKKYIKTWREQCPDYEIIEWNEHNYDVSKNVFMRKHILRRILLMFLTMQDWILFILMGGSI